MDIQITLGKGTAFELPGTLSLPENREGAVPGVVLVHGSGAHDRDETIMQNKPFKDIAEYLCAHGIATLRYDKRTYAYKDHYKHADLRDMTVEEEVIEDAIGAGQLLKEHGDIDSGRVFLVGHSMGGMLAPRIDAEGGDFAGLVIMAGTPRTLGEVIMSQNDMAVADLGFIMRKIAQRQVAKLEAKFQAMKTMTEEEAKSTKIISKTYAWYFKEMEDHPVSGYLKETTKPLLFMQGEDDFQVLWDLDFAQYKEICQGNPRATFKLYPGLNHLFMQSSGEGIRGFRKEYKEPRHVSDEVLHDLVDWIHQVNQ